MVEYDTADDPTFSIVLEMKDDSVPSEPKGKVRTADSGVIATTSTESFL